jgi:hypothetical protein
LEKIVQEFSKLEDNFAVFSILKLCKNKKIPIPFENLTIPAKTLKELIKFIMENTEINFEDSFYTTLSNDNKYYVMKNFKCSHVNDFNISEEINSLELKESKSLQVFENSRTEISIPLLKEDIIIDSYIETPEIQIKNENENKMEVEQNISKLDDDYIIY